MELLFESRLEILRAAGKLQFFQRPAAVNPEPVVVADRPTDANGAYIYGSIRTRLHTLGPWERLQDTTDYPGYGLDEALPQTGDALAETVCWKSGSVIHPIEGRRVVARLYLERAKAYAWEIDPLPEPTLRRGGG